MYLSNEKNNFADNSRVEPTIFLVEKLSFSLKLFSDHFNGQSFIKTVRGPLLHANNKGTDHPHSLISAYFIRSTGCRIAELAIDNFTIVFSLCSRASRFMHYRMLVKMLITFEPHQKF